MNTDYLLDNGGPSLNEVDYRGWCRAEAARLRKAADTADTIEVRVGMLELAEQLERRARGESPT